MDNVFDHRYPDNRVPTEYLIIAYDKAQDVTPSDDIAKEYEAYIVGGLASRGQIYKATARDPEAALDMVRRRVSKNGTFVGANHILVIDGLSVVAEYREVRRTEFETQRML